MILSELERIKADYDNGIIVSKSTVLKVLDWAIALTAYHETPKTIAEPDAEGWIEHTTGKRPVPGYMKVDIYTSCDERDGYVQDIREADSWDWRDIGGTGILKYRIVK